MLEDGERDVRQSREDLAECQSMVAWEKSHHIKQCSVFGGVVRKLIVNAHATGNSVFEQSCLIETLAYLPNLHALVWRGESPRMSAGLIESLATHCPILAELSALSIHKSHLWPLEPFHAVPFKDFESAEELRVAVPSVLMTVPESLRELMLSGPGVWDNMDIFRNLTYLDLIDSGGWNEDDPVPPAWSCFPVVSVQHLTSLKDDLVEYAEDLHPAWAFGISEFLRKKPHLRRLDLRIDVEWNTTISLEILGIHICGKILEHLGTLERSIPPRVFVLRLDPLFSDSPTLPEWLSLASEAVKAHGVQTPNFDTPNQSEPVESACSVA
ncbi:hypothetical protein CERSUDRAFT_74499 [Gelatoporia subvermispora B]|uniref:F-box domain-containing protein n=1 Tax=Ceriporiopsis subvermispora (strain B) TaxID=914234 RepID=M2QWQ2_CERS8|nr:hypothetical protein CERSUDRAFT_74499 [Gelatoporia subvermispora B]